MVLPLTDKVRKKFNNQRNRWFKQKAFVKMHSPVTDLNNAASSGSKRRSMFITSHNPSVGHKNTYRQQPPAARPATAG